MLSTCRLRLLRSVEHPTLTDSMRKENSLVRSPAELPSTWRNVKETWKKPSLTTTIVSKERMTTLRLNSHWRDSSKVKVTMISAKRSATESWSRILPTSRLPSWLPTYCWWRARQRLPFKPTSSCLKSPLIISTLYHSWLSYSDVPVEWTSSKLTWLTLRRPAVAVTWLVSPSARDLLTTTNISQPKPLKSSTLPDKTVCSAL